LIVGEEEPDGGILRIGETVRLAYVDQSRDTLNGERQVWGGDQMTAKPSSGSASGRSPPDPMPPL